MVVKKNLVLYERDEHGLLIPQERKLVLHKQEQNEQPELKDQTVFVIPLTRGELKRRFGAVGKSDDKEPDPDKDTDAEIVSQCCKNP